MVRIGHFADVHHPREADAFRSDLAHLVEERAADLLLWGGDQVAGREPAVPHAPAEDVRSFWDAVEAAVGSSVFEVSYAVPGNHDVPFTHWIEVSSEYLDPSHLRTPIRLRPAEGVTVLAVNTQGPAIVQGGGDSVAQNHCFVPYHELRWLDRELAAAADRGDVRIVVGHAPVAFGTDPALECYHPEAPWTDRRLAYLGDDQAYEVPQNFQAVWRTLDAHAPVVYLSGHDYHGPGSGGSLETARTVGGVHHVWQDHYSIGPSTVGFLDADPAAGSVEYVTVNSVAHPSEQGHSEQVIVSTTEDW